MKTTYQQNRLATHVAAVNAANAAYALDSEDLLKILAPFAGKKIVNSTPYRRLSSRVLDALQTAEWRSGKRPECSVYGSFIVFTTARAEQTPDTDHSCDRIEHRVEAYVSLVNHSDLPSEADLRASFHKSHHLRSNWTPAEVAKLQDACEQAREALRTAESNLGPFRPSA